MSTINGDNILYHYIQKHLLNEPDIATELIEKLVMDLSIWLPVTLYEELPIILPYVVRDPTCRKRGRDQKEEWGSADEFGFFRDDNSLIKGIPRSFQIHGGKIRQYRNKKLGTGFTSCHIWRVIEFEGSEIISNRHHLFNSFIPNIVWLPRQIAKLTDRDGSIAQRVLQAMSYKYYRDVTMPDDIESLWEYLLCPSEYRTLELDTDKMNFFKITDEWILKRKSKLNNEISRILTIGEQYVPSMGKVKCRRYLPTLSTIPIENRRKLTSHLKNYEEILKYGSDIPKKKFSG